MTLIQIVGMLQLVVYLIFLFCFFTSNKELFAEKRRFMNVEIVNTAANIPIRSTLLSKIDDYTNNSLIYSHQTILENKFIIFIPYCDFSEDFIIECLTSVENQKYDNIEVIIVNDGGNKIEHIISFIADKHNYKILNFEQSNGPAFSKWKFFEHIQQNIADYSYNDIIVIMDGDDYFNNANALNIINIYYNEYKCWFTYGHSIGKFIPQKTIPIPQDWNMNVRENKWIYPHPRTFKLFLTLSFRKSDFLYRTGSNGSWLTKGTDRPLVYTMLEWSGRERIQNINEILYNYREHNYNTYYIVSPKNKHAQIEYVNNLPSKDVVIEDIHIVMCTFGRIDNILPQIKSLNKQSVAHRIKLHILNNNVNEAQQFYVVIEKFNRTRNESNIVIYLHQFQNKYFGFQRFLYIRDVLLPNYISDYVIMIDDDQLFDEFWVENMYALRKPHTFVTWYGKVWPQNKSLDYWEGSIIDHTDCIGQHQKNVTRFHYGGTGGSLIDTNVFTVNSILWDVPDHDLPKGVTVYNVEDLWLSFVILKYYQNWTIERSFMPIYGIGSNDKHALWLKLRKQKQIIFEYLVHQRQWFSF